MNAPIPKYELVLSRCPNPQAIAASAATLRAQKWIRANLCYMDAMSHMMMDSVSEQLNGEKKLPANYTLCVNECYDFEEVIAFLGNKEWAHISPLKPTPVSIPPLFPFLQ